MKMSGMRILSILFFMLFCMPLVAEENEIPKIEVS